jgi:hypothetical protein
VGNHLKVGREIDCFHRGIRDNGTGGVNHRTSDGTQRFLRSGRQCENEDKETQNKNLSQIKSHEESLALSKVSPTKTNRPGNHRWMQRGGTGPRAQAWTTCTPTAHRPETRFEIGIRGKQTNDYSPMAPKVWQILHLSPVLATAIL